VTASHSEGRPDWSGLGSLPVARVIRPTAAVARARVRRWPTRRWRESTPSRERLAANSIIRPRAWADDFYRSQNTTTP
jgi:hypothetical protein